jgi:AcrR family transcriptional regulator
MSLWQSLTRFPEMRFERDQMSQDIDFMRRNPSQERANATVDTIFEATARIVEQGESGQLTTNHIAEKAGYSVGTLYGYFPNKQSLLRAMALREMRRQEALLMEKLRSIGPGQSDEDLVRIVIRAALRPFENRSRLRLGLLRILVRDDDVKAAAQSVQEHILDLLLTAISSRHPHSLSLSASMRFTLLTAVSGTIQAAALERPDLFETAGFEDEIVNMVLGALGRAATERTTPLPAASAPAKTPSKRR